MKLSQFRRLIKEEVKKVLKEAANPQVMAAINKNKAALTAAIKNRLTNDWDEEASDAVEALFKKTALEAGLPKAYVERYPWMENYAVPDESTVAKDLSNLQGHFQDALNDPEIMTATTKSGPGMQQARDVYMKAASQGIYNLGQGKQPAIRKRMDDANNRGSNIGGWLDADCFVVKEGQKTYVVFMPTSWSDEPVGVAEIKNNQIGADVNDNGTKSRLAAKITQAGLGKFKERNKMPQSANPALTGEVQVPEASQIQRELGGISESTRKKR